jgi:uncharacterized RDD family membrane protein YckC
MLDTTYRIATPEGVELALRLAGPVPRALAWVIDLLWRLALYAVLAGALAGLGEVGSGIILITLFVLEWLAPAWFEVVFDGATPGKKALGIRVLREDGAPVDVAAALTRNLLRAADFLPMLYFGGLLAMLCSSRFQRLGDRVAGTIVVHVDPRQVPLQVPTGPSLAPPVALRLEDKRVVLDFAERSLRLAPGRSAELAAIPTALTGSGDGARAQPLLIAMANHLVGRRGTGAPPATAPRAAAPPSAAPPAPAPPPAPPPPSAAPPPAPPPPPSTTD